MERTGECLATQQEAQQETSPARENFARPIAQQAGKLERFHRAPEEGKAMKEWLRTHCGPQEPGYSQEKGM